MVDSTIYFASPAKLEGLCKSEEKVILTEEEQKRVSNIKEVDLDGFDTKVESYHSEASVKLSLAGFGISTHWEKDHTFTLLNNVSMTDIAVSSRGNLFPESIYYGFGFFAAVKLSVKRSEAGIETWGAVLDYSEACSSVAVHLLGLNRFGEGERGMAKICADLKNATTKKGDAAIVLLDKGLQDFNNEISMMKPIEKEKFQIVTVGMENTQYATSKEAEYEGRAFN